MGILSELGARGLLGFVQGGPDNGVDPETGPYLVDLGDSTQIEFSRADSGWNWTRNGGYHATPIGGHVEAGADMADLAAEMLGPRLRLALEDPGPGPDAGEAGSAGYAEAIEDPGAELNLADAARWAPAADRAAEAEPEIEP